VQVAQFLKEDVASEIARAGLRVFASRGYRAASMAEIAREAGISTGNVYRYFASKEVLFEHLVPASLQEQLLGLLEARVRSVDQAGFADAAEVLMEFSLGHRLQLVILLGRAEGTLHEGFARELCTRLQTLALAHFDATEPSAPLAFALREIYAHFVATMVQALAEHDDPRAVRAAVEAYTRYHGAGMRALFAGRSR
jgi:AcrR family transcriptional regulator